MRSRGTIVSPQFRHSHQGDRRIPVRQQHIDARQRGRDDNPVHLDGLEVQECAPGFGFPVMCLEIEVKGGDSQRHISFTGRKNPGQ